MWRGCTWVVLPEPVLEDSSDTCAPVTSAKTSDRRWYTGRVSRKAYKEVRSGACTMACHQQAWSRGLGEGSLGTTAGCVHQCVLSAGVDIRDGLSSTSLSLVRHHVAGVPGWQVSGRGDGGRRHQHSPLGLRQGKRRDKHGVLRGYSKHVCHVHVCRCMHLAHRALTRSGSAPHRCLCSWKTGPASCTDHGSTRAPSC